MNIRGNTHVVDIPVVVSQNSVSILHRWIKEQLVPLIFGHRPGNLVRVHDKIEWAESLSNSEQVLTSFVHRPRIWGMKCRHHFFEKWFKPISRKLSN